MKEYSIVTSVMSKVSLPATKLENDINKHRKLSRSKFRSADGFLLGFENISWQFANIPARGSLEIIFADQRNNKTFCLDVPAATGFLAGFTKRRQGSYKLTFGVSLS